MQRFWLILITLLTEASLTRAQWPEYGVYHTIGRIQCLRAKGGATQVLGKGSWIYSGDELLLADGIADIILFDRDSNYIHVKGKGRYTTVDLSTLQRSHVRDNITIRYLYLVWEELFRPGSDQSATGSTGGVSRGGSLMLFPADDYRSSLDRVLFRWQPVVWATHYRLRMTDDGGRLVYDSAFKDTQVIVRVRPPLSFGQRYHWALDLEGLDDRHQEGATGELQLVDEKKVLAGADDAIAEPDALPGLNTSLMRAEEYERLGCTRSANAVYLRLLSADREDMALQVLYREFRRRNGIAATMPKGRL